MTLVTQLIAENITHTFPGWGPFTGVSSNRRESSTGSKTAGLLLNSLFPETSLTPPQYKFLSLFSALVWILFFILDNSSHTIL